MNRFFRRFVLPASAAVALSVAAASAIAARPASIANTTWTMQIDRDSVQLVVTTQGGPGAPGAAFCRHINGTLGIAPVRGWYCPESGDITLLHNNLDSGKTMRVFIGSVSNDVIGQRLYMAGTMRVMDAVFGDLGEYNFSAIR
jgi:hypothetical protein